MNNERSSVFKYLDNEVAKEMQGFYEAFDLLPKLGRVNLTRNKCTALTIEQIQDMHAEATRGYCIEFDHYLKAERDAEFAHCIGDAE